MQVMRVRYRQTPAPVVMTIPNLPLFRIAQRQLLPVDDADVLEDE